MIPTLSIAAHTIFSLILHAMGISLGLFIWYLFPKNPTRCITRMPVKQVRVRVEQPGIEQEERQGLIGTNREEDENWREQLGEEKQISSPLEMHKSVRSYG